MFSRYSKINIPQNYSGNRFKAPETDTKIHSPVPQYTVKNAHSPSFISTFEEKDQPFEEAYEDEKVSVQVEDMYEESTYEREEIIDTPVCVDQKSDNESKGFDLSYFKNILSNISSEELLILGIILLIASDKESSNNSIIWMLALLLLGKE